MDQIIIVGVFAAIFYKFHILSPESLSARFLKFVEDFGKNTSAHKASNGKEVFYVRIRK